VMVREAWKGPPKYPEIPRKLIKRYFQDKAAGGPVDWKIFRNLIGSEGKKFKWERLDVAKAVKSAGAEVSVESAASASRFGRPPR